MDGVSPPSARLPRVVMRGEAGLTAALLKLAHMQLQIAELEARLADLPHEVDRALSALLVGDVGAVSGLSKLMRLLAARQSTPATADPFAAAQLARMLGLAQILRNTCAQSGCSEDDLCGPQRHAVFVEARSYFAWVAREAGYSLAQIGSALGGRDHTTALNLVRRGYAAQAAAQAAGLAVQDV